MDKIYNYYEFVWCFHICAKNVQLNIHVHCPYPRPNCTWSLHDDYLNKFVCVCVCVCFLCLLECLFIYFCLFFFVFSRFFTRFFVLRLWISWCRFGYDDAYLYWGFGTLMRTKVLITSSLGMYCKRPYVFFSSRCVSVWNFDFRFNVERKKVFGFFRNCVRVRKLNRIEYDGFHLTCAAQHSL